MPVHDTQQFAPVGFSNGQLEGRPSACFQGLVIERVTAAWQQEACLPSKRYSSPQQCALRDTLSKSASYKSCWAQVAQGSWSGLDSHACFSFT